MSENPTSANPTPETDVIRTPKGLAAPTPLLTGKLPRSRSPFPGVLSGLRDTKAIEVRNYTLTSKNGVLLRNTKGTAVCSV